MATTPEPVETPEQKAAMRSLQEQVPGENHHHTDAHPAVISGNEARGSNPNGAGFNIMWISTAAIVIGMVIVAAVFL